jgi:uncharacterized protein
LAGERDLSRLLQGLRPRLYPERYAFAATAEPTLRPNQFALVREDEGLTSIHPDPQGEWARISLEIHSSLDAVGLTGVMASRLADLGISVNIIAALRHDHLFVPWDRREEALECLRSLQGEAENRSA